MSLLRFSLQNRYAVLSAVTALCVLGVAVIPGITIDILPDFKKPVVVSFFSYPGLPTMDMEKSVTSRVERALTLAGKIEHQESRTVPGAAVIKIFFQPGADASSAMNDIVNLEASDMFHLPPGIEWPFTLRSEPSNLPVVLAAISGEGLSESQLYTIGYYAVRNKMGGLKGVQIPHPFGGKFRQMMVYVDPAKLRAYHISPTDVVTALRKSNLVLAAGTAEIGGTDYQVHPRNTLPTTEEIEAIPVVVREDRPVFIRDVARVVDDAALQYNIVRVNGKRSVYCPLLREPGENTISVVDRIYEGIGSEIPKMKKRGDIPEATEVKIGFGSIGVHPQSDEESVDADRVGRPSGCDRCHRVSAQVPAHGDHHCNDRLCRPHWCLGIRVHRSNDQRHDSGWNRTRDWNSGRRGHCGRRECGAPPANGKAAWASRLGRYVGSLRRDLGGHHHHIGRVLAGRLPDRDDQILIHASVARGDDDHWCVVHPGTHGGACLLRQFSSRTADTRNRLNVGPRRDLASRKSRRLRTFSLGPPSRPGRWRAGRCSRSRLDVFSCCRVWERNCFRKWTRVRLKSGSRRCPGTKLEETEALVARLEETIQSVIPKEEIETLIANIGLPVGKGAGFSTVLSSNSGPDTAYLIVNLKQQNRKTPTVSYIEQLREKLAEEYPLEQFLFVSGGIVNMALNEGVPTPISVQVSAGTIGKCREEAERIVRAIRPIDGTADVQIAQSLDYPQFDVQVDRTRAKYLGVDQEEVAQTVLTALGSSVGYSPTIWIDPKTGVDFFMGVQYEGNEFQSLDDIRNIPISLDTAKGPMTIPLANIATVRRVNIPGEVAHYNIARVNDVHVNVSGRDLGSVASEIRSTLDEMDFENGVSVTLRGPVEKMQSGMKMLGIGLAVATLLVYLVLMAQFRSFIDPLIIMLAVPLGFGGVILVLHYTNTCINIQSLIGTLMMVGVVVNNSILLVDFANQRRSKGLPAKDAILSAAQVRLRPILMTSLTLIASMIPLSFQLAPGNEAMMSLSRALLGGMVVSTILTLVLIPCVYTLMHGRDDPATLAG